MVRVWDAAETKIREFGPHKSWPQAVAFSEDGTKLASGGQDRMIRVWNIRDGKEIGPSGGIPYAVWRISISADGAIALTDSLDETLRVWDTRTGLLRRQIATSEYVTECHLIADGAKVVAVVGHWDKPEKALKMWDVATGAESSLPGFPKTIGRNRSGSPQNYLPNRHLRCSGAR
jgi:WD40 repeat protein